MTTFRVRFVLQSHVLWEVTSKRKRKNVYRVLWVRTKANPVSYSVQCAQQSREGKVSPCRRVLGRRPTAKKGVQQASTTTTKPVCAGVVVTVFTSRRKAVSNAFCVASARLHGLRKQCPERLVTWP